MYFDPRLHLIDFVVQTTPADEAFRAISSDLQHVEVQVSVYIIFIVLIYMYHIIIYKLCFVLLLLSIVLYCHLPYCHPCLRISTW